MIRLGALVLGSCVCNPSGCVDPGLLCVGSVRVRWSSAPVCVIRPSALVLGSCVCDPSGYVTPRLLVCDPSGCVGRQLGTGTWVSADGSPALYVSAGDLSG
jgi:hypothetical protein